MSDLDHVAHSVEVKLFMKWSLLNWLSEFLWLLMLHLAQRCSVKGQFAQIRRCGGHSCVRGTTQAGCQLFL